jgi:membrane glycosyltransferase
MKKWIGPFLLLLFIVVLVWISSPLHVFKKGVTEGGKRKNPRILLIQEEGGEKKEEIDTHLILILKRLREKLDEWLKSLNERIESENVTRLEVRFLEILRNILEWVRDRVNAKIESYEKQRPEKKEKGLPREIRLRVSPSSETRREIERE